MSSFIFLFIDRHFLRVSPVIVRLKIAEWTVDKYFDIYITNGTNGTINSNFFYRSIFTKFIFVKNNMIQSQKSYKL